MNTRVAKSISVACVCESLDIEAFHSACFFQKHLLFLSRCLLRPMKSLFPHTPPSQVNIMKKQANTILHRGAKLTNCHFTNYGESQRANAKLHARGNLTLNNNSRSCFVCGNSSAPINIHSHVYLLISMLPWQKNFKVLST